MSPIDRTEPLVDLRLFPLARIVLVPGMAVTLQVFEPRYRALVAECLEDGAPFGVVLIREGDEVGEADGPIVPHSIGTTARITSVIPGPDGRLHLEAIGERRFRILMLRHDRSYLSAEVEFPVEEVGSAPLSMMEQAREGLRQLEQLRAIIRGAYERGAELPQTPSQLADRILVATSLPVVDGGAYVAERQRLLEDLDAGRRLREALPLLERAITGLHQQASAVVADRWAGLGAAN